ncbi:hypothetical protein ACEQ8H_000220 [Pleosporales sp. CAS-2024a]
MPARAAVISALLDLCNAACNISLTLSSLHQDDPILASAIRELAVALQHFGAECELAHATLIECGLGRPTLVPGKPTPDVDVTLWDCLSVQTEESALTLQELEQFTKTARGEDTNFAGQAQRPRKVDKPKEKIAHARTKVARHTLDLRFTLHLAQILVGDAGISGTPDSNRTMPSPHVRSQSEQQPLSRTSRIEDMMQMLQTSSATDRHSRISHVESALLRYANHVIVQGTTTVCAGHADSNGTQPLSSIRAAKWLEILGSIRQEQTFLCQPKRVPAIVVAGGHVAATTDSEDDLDIDLVKAALDTGTKAFAEQQWDDANYLLNEALRLLQQLSSHQRIFCDIFDVHYKLAVCAYHVLDYAEAEEALVSLIQESASSDTQRAHVSDATHLLAQLYVRTGHVDDARSECEKALQARRKLLGKQSDAALESLALMAHICVLQDSRAVAKSYLSMIPESRREAILYKVETSLGSIVDHLDFSSLLNPPIPRSSPRSVYEVVPRAQGRVASPDALEMRRNKYDHNASTPESVTHSPMAILPRLESKNHLASPVHLHSRAPSSSAASIAESARTERQQQVIPTHAPNTPTPLRTSQSLETLSLAPKNLTRKDILDKVGCQPRDPIEEAVCASLPLSAFSALVAKKKGFFWSGLRKRVRPERVTALHFAALFGELEMARRLLDAHFDINVVPFGYTTSLTPLHFAIGARQVTMVEFLIANGARPVEPDTWSTLAGQLLSRAWLAKTMSEAERETVAHRIMGIMTTLLKGGWDVNCAIDASGKTVLHQAVSFWTGSYRWDLELRTTVTEWLCEKGADAYARNAEGKTPWDLAVENQHEDIAMILGRYSRQKGLGYGVVEPVELPGYTM